MPLSQNGPVNGLLQAALSPRSLAFHALRLRLPMGDARVGIQAWSSPVRAVLSTAAVIAGWSRTVV